jgi:hypothetical protein
VFPKHFRQCINQNSTRKRTMLRSINEAHIRQDFLTNYADQINRYLSQKDLRFQEILKNPYEESEDLQIAGVVEIKYRMTLYFEQLPPKLNIAIAWLLMFIGSLEY